jgi:hypothetical protein
MSLGVDFDAVAQVPGDQTSKEGGSGRRSLVSQDFGISQTGGVVDSDMNETFSSQDAGHRGRARADANRDLEAGLPTPAQSEDLFDNDRMSLTGRTIRPRTAIDQRRRAGLLITTLPLRSRPAGNTGRLGGAGHGDACLDALDQQHSTGRASSGILVKLHLGSFVETVASDTSSLTDLGPDGQLLHGNNVLRNHN